MAVWSSRAKNADFGHQEYNWVNRFPDKTTWELLWNQVCKDTTMAIGTLCFSFDFELGWPSRGLVSSPVANQELIEKTWTSVPGMLQILEKYDIPATWATVGAIMLQHPWKGRDRLQDPAYSCGQKNWYDFPEYNSSFSRCFYAPQLVEMILKCRAPQEIGSHTFTHVLMNRSGHPENLLDQELRLCNEVADEWGIRLESLVFPRNQCKQMSALVKNRYKIYRSLNTEWYWFKHHIPTSRDETKALGLIFPYVISGLRLLDEKFRLAPQSYDLNQYQELIELKHSAFLPGFSGVSRFVSVKDRVRRIECGINKAIRNKKILSVYFHPQNMNHRQDDCFEYFDSICRIASEKRDRGELAISSMTDLANSL